MSILLVIILCITALAMVETICETIVESKKYKNMPEDENE